MDFSKVRDFEYSYYSLADVVPWSALIAPGIVINKDESFLVDGKIPHSVWNDYDGKTVMIGITIK